VGRRSDYCWPSTASWQINAANSFDCKTCDIKGPYEIIGRVVPDGGTGQTTQTCNGTRESRNGIDPGACDHLYERRRHERCQNMG
jgi:hypothetical protein